MAEHRFGGDWTQEKLASLKGYLLAYRSIFATNPRAKFFTTWYVDAFAGSGSITTSLNNQENSLLLEDYGIDEERKTFLDGSTRIALDLSSPFDRYLFIDASRKRAGALQTMVEQDFPRLADRVSIQVDDANSALLRWSGERDWSKERAVVFLDPYGMQVNWNTIEILAATQGVDLWYLFPFATRLLRNDRNISELWARKLDSLFGTTEWATRFYPVRIQNTLFGPIENTERDATVGNIQGFVEERLRTCFAEVATSRVLRNSTHSPLYTLCFAASNPKGAKPQ